MPTRELRIGQTGYIRPTQMWVQRSQGASSAQLYIEPVFYSRAEMQRGMLRVICTESKATPGEPRYGIYLPADRASLGELQYITESEAKRRKLMRIVRVLRLGGRPLQKPFDTVSWFYFHNA